MWMQSSRFFFLCLSLWLSVAMAESVDLSTRLKGASTGDAHAQLNLGAAYDNGLGVKRDVDKALHWYQQAAEQGVAVLAMKTKVRMSIIGGRRTARSSHARFFFDTLFFARSLWGCCVATMRSPERVRARGRGPGARRSAARVRRWARGPLGRGQ